MAAASIYIAQAILGMALKNTAFTSPSANLYLGLAASSFSGDNSNQSAHEISYSGYARQQINSWTTPSGSTEATSNSNPVSFAALPTGVSLTVGYWGLFDALSGGNMVAYGPFDTAKSFSPNNIPSIAANELIIQFAAGGVSTDFAQKMLKHIIVGGFTYSRPAMPYLALYVGDPTAGGTEASWGGAGSYARQGISAWSAFGSNNYTANSNPFSFGACSGLVSPLGITHIALMDASSSGNIMLYGALANTETLNNADVFACNAGDISAMIS